MTRRSRRQLKKLHRHWLDLGVIDATQRSYWRARLFDSAPGESFEISRADPTGLSPDTIAAIRKYRLRYTACVVPAHEAPAWLAESGLVIFKFQAVDFPTVCMFSGNNRTAKESGTSSGVHRRTPG